ncbi:sprouty-related, EVH1 domain-containing protein 2 [Atheta coriaria]|uniref:sprouty-related, EVH1 domain-containing protein 2 n=1 Tax=Dalotia coriaria TaxID=877792 RepID=UPI0031F45942
MTDTSEDGNYLVRVRAQVMSRDDSSGGWVPLGGGGLSNVSVRKRPRVSSLTQGPESSKQKHDYLIHGMRISDECQVLACTIKKDFVYNKVMPTFHHWKTEDKKFGLTFQTAADARAFDKGVRSAVEELLDGYSDVCPQSAYQNEMLKDVGDDDVFMTLNLPQEPSRSSSDSSSKGSETLHQQQRQYITSTKDRPELRQLVYDTPTKGTAGSEHENGGEKSDNYSYVQLTSVHEYMYPIMPDEQQKPSPGRRDSASSLKKSVEMVSTAQPPASHFKSGKEKGGVGGLGAGAGGSTRIKYRCRYCQELYFEDQNRRGACDEAPDGCKAGIEKITCISCAQCVSYHCASDAEGDFAQHPCDCSDYNCGKRWICLTFLSLFVPCLWFYPPLKLCHWCGVKCGVCGGKHHVTQN